MLSEKYSPIKEAKHKDEHSIEDDKEEDEDYSSVENSESTLKHKYSNAANNLIGGQKNKQAAAIEDSMASSSYIHSSAGKE